MKQTAISLLLFVGLLGCQSGPCRTVKNPELERQQATKQLPAATSIGGVGGVGGNPQKKSEAPSPEINVTKNGAKPILPILSTIFVYKADGSLQCGQGKAISLEEMEKQLKGIKIHSKENRSDGLMHIQVCGSPTGMINVFEIDAKDLKKAEKRGFKKFEAR